TDMFLGALIADLSASDEETVLVLYGDHLPCFDYTADDLADGSTPYQTEYVIWSSFGITEEDRDLYAYQLTAHVQSCIGMDEGILTRLHQTYLSSDAPDTVHNAYLSALQTLEYDMLYGDREAWDGVSPHLPTDLQYGIEPVLIHGIRSVGTSLYITGEHFTPYSRALIGSFQTETVYVDENTLMLPDAAPDEGDHITVIQSGADGIPLGKSNVYVFDGPS
ncbi:MAG: IPT/TIG domain-containing protein, partial [Clostridia bacterium]|nr:IPT/TIG domain-containing protein [Clostridia bacterium]